MDKTNAILVTIVGILWALPLLGVNALGSVTSGILAWIIVIAILTSGIIGLSKNFK